MRHLEQAPRSTRQVAQRLRSRGVPPHVADEVLAWLTDLGYLDDAAFADMLVRSRTATKMLGRRALLAELAAKGIGPELRVAAIAQVSHDDELTMARALVAKRAPSLAALEPVVAKRRLAGLLARKGYASATIAVVLADLH